MCNFSGTWSRKPPWWSFWASRGFGCTALWICLLEQCPYHHSAQLLRRSWWDFESKRPPEALQPHPNGPCQNKQHPSEGFPTNFYLCLCPLNVLYFTVIPQSCAKSENPLEALKVAESMRKEGVAMDSVTYNALIFACIKGRRLDKALHFLEQMKVNSFQQMFLLFHFQFLRIVCLLSFSYKQGGRRGYVTYSTDIHHDY